MAEKCFADDGYGCMALKEKECKECKFYKSESQYLEGVRETRRIVKASGGVLYNER